MGDRILAGGIDVVGTFEPIQLWAGEPNGQSTQGTAKSGNIFGALNSRGDTYLFAVVAMAEDGELIPWNPLASDGYDDYATGTLTIANAVPAAGDKFTINGVDVIFRAAADPDLKEVTIGATLAATIANATDVVNTFRNDFGVAGGVTATNAGGAVLTIRSPGTAGNAVTLAKTFATGANGTVSGANLSGGTDSDAELGGAALPVGILPHYLDTTATGYNADVDTPYFISGHFNWEALKVPAGTTYLELKRAFARTPINIQQLY